LNVKTKLFYNNDLLTLKYFHVTTQPTSCQPIVLQPATELDAIRWILAEAGKIRVIEPTWLGEKVVIAGKKIVEVNS
jgi:hypothetical protein